MTSPSSSESPRSTRQREQKTKLLLIGPAHPERIGGSGVVFKQLLAGLADDPELDVTVIDTERRSGAVGAIAWAAGTLLQVAFSMSRYDVVSLHASGRRARLFGPWLGLLCRLFGKPWIFRGFGGAYDLLFETMSRLERSIFSQTVLHADAVLLQTHGQVAYFHDRGIRNVQWYGNSRPQRAEAAVRSSESSGARRFIYVGHVQPSKGIREIIRAAQLLPDGVVIEVFGGLRDGLEEHEFQQSNVRYGGVLAPGDVPQTIAMFDALLLPTYYEGEGYPGAILEAYSVGVPVITTRWRSIPEIVDDECGLLIEPRSPEALAAAMRRMIDSPDLVAKLSTGARKKAEEFSAEQWTERFVQIVRSLKADPQHTQPAGSNE